MRLLQSIEGVSLDVETQRCLPPEWATAGGRKTLERVALKHHLTTYVCRSLAFVPRNTESW